MIAGAVYTPWVLRSYLLTGNPIFPLAFRWLGGKGLDAGRAAALHDVQWSYGLGKNISAVFLLPWNLTFHSQSFDYAVGPVLLAGIPILVFYCPWRKVGVAVWASLLFSILWFIGSQQIRYFYFSLAMSTVFLAAALDSMAQRYRVEAQIFGALLGFNIALSCVQAQRQYAAGWHQIVHRYSNPYLLGRYVKYATSLQMVQDTVPDSAEVVLLDAWAESLYYFPRHFRQGGRAILATNFWDIQAQDQDSLRQKMRRYQMGYIFADKVTVSLDSYITAGRGTLIRQDDSYAIYKLNLN